MSSISDKCKEISGIARMTFPDNQKIAYQIEMLTLVLLEGFDQLQVDVDGDFNPDDKIGRDYI